MNASAESIESYTCPCCGSGARTVEVERVAFDDVERGLKHDLGVDVPIPASLRPAPYTSLRVCPSCGLQRFTPAVPGDANFYATLAKTGAYYQPIKWEFGWVRGRISEATSVLDAGCGAGDFLATLGARPGRRLGLELNPTSAALAQRKGLEVRISTVEELASAEGGAFDVACSFHVLEHVAAPAPFLASLARCVRPGGRLFLSVPNAERFYRAPFEPLDCPPHHLSRWSLRALRALGARAGCELTAHAFEPVASDIVRYVVEKRVARSAGAAAGWFVARAVCPPGLSRVAEFAGLYGRLGLHGLSVVVEYAVP